MERRKELGELPPRSGPESPRRASQDLPRKRPRESLAVAKRPRLERECPRCGDDAAILAVSDVYSDPATSSILTLQAGVSQANWMP